MPVLTKAASSVYAAGGWTNAANAYASDNVYATVAIATATSQTFAVGGFDFSSVPAGSTINSVTVTVENKVSTTTSATMSSVPRVAGTAIGSTVALTLSTADVQRTYNPTVLPTLAQLKDSTFNIWVQAVSNNTTSKTFSVDFIQVAVNYTVPVTLPTTETFGGTSFADANFTITPANGTFAFVSGKGRFTNPANDYSISAGIDHPVGQQDVGVKFDYDATSQGDGFFAVKLRGAAVATGYEIRVFPPTLTTGNSGADVYDPDGNYISYQLANFASVGPKYTFEFELSGTVLRAWASSAGNSKQILFIDTAQTGPSIGTGLGNRFTLYTTSGTADNSTAEIDNLYVGGALPVPANVPVAFSGEGGLAGWNQAKIAAWSNALYNRTTAPAKWLAVGDSFTEGQGSPTYQNRWVNRVLRALRSTLGLPLGGDGYKPFNFATYNESVQTYAPGDPWYVWQGSSGSYEQTVSQMSLGRRSVIGATGASVTFTNSFNGTAVEVWWINDRAGTFTVSVDGTATGTTYTSVADGSVGMATIPLGATGVHSAQFNITTGAIHFAGVTEIRGDGSSGIRLYEGAHSGYTSADFLGMGLVHAKVAPDLFTICLGYNDPGNGITPVQTTANIKQIISEYRAAVGSKQTSIVVVIPGAMPKSNFAGPNGTTWADYQAAMRQVALDDPTVGTLVTFDTGTSAAQPQNYSSDGEHLNATGQPLISNKMYRELAVSQQAVATNYNGNAVFTGSGSAAGSGRPAATGSINPNGSGSITQASGIANYTGTLAGSGSGTLTATSPQITLSGTAADDGTGTATGTGSPAVSGSSDATGSGTLTYTFDYALVTVVPFVGEGQLLASGVAQITGSANFSGSGTTTRTATPDVPGSAAYSGTGTATPQGTAATFGAGAGTGVGSLAVVSGRPSPVASWDATGSGTLSAVANTSFAGSGAASGSGSLGAVGAAGPTSNLMLSGSGTLTQAALSLTASGVATLSGSGSLAAVPVPNPVQSVGSGGTGVLTASGAASAPGVAAFTGTGNTDPSGTRPEITGAQGLASGLGSLLFAAKPGHTSNAGPASGSGTAVATGKPNPTGRLDGSGSGSLVAYGFSTEIGSGFASFTSTATLVLDPLVSVEASVDLSGEGDLEVDALVSQSDLAALGGSGTLTYEGVQNLGGEAQFTSTGSLQVAGVPRPVSVALFTNEGLVMTSAVITVDAALANFFGPGTLIGIYGDSYRDLDLLTGEPSLEWEADPPTMSRFPRTLPRFGG